MFKNEPFWHLVKKFEYAILKLIKFGVKMSLKKKFGVSLKKKKKV